ncbi:MAG TPA: hypothetical protein DDZ80_13310 [Cyanobacteria bacterium UBA8803]|nr:hypothetical protein [Cyanobacteria bacterium UBA9273]HBL59449.1 hypothetical protein [Cyanobacteria bacterium UBA8803]
MNFKLVQNLSAAAAATTLVCLTASAQAASLTSSNFGKIVKFNSDQEIEFTFVESHGMWRSDLGIYTGNNKLVKTLFSERNPGYDKGSNDAKNDWLGTCGKTVLPTPGTSTCTTQFTFLAGVEYFFGLTGSKGTVFSNTNPAATRFTYGDGSYTYNTQGPSWIEQNPGKKPTTNTIQVSIGQALLAINDSHTTDQDVNDMLVSARAVQAVPEPGTVGALIGIGTLGLMRRRQRKPTAD